MKKFIPYDKLSKKKKKERNAEKRVVWTISPVTRRPKDPKAYDRNKARNWENDPDPCLVYFLILKDCQRTSRLTLVGCLASISGCSKR